MNEENRLDVLHNWHGVQMFAALNLIKGRDPVRADGIGQRAVA